VVIRRTLLDAAGGFDAGLPACEDYDLWLRVALRAPVHLVSELLTIRYAGHAGQLSTRHWGMDRFRVAALARLLSTAPIEGERREQATEVLARKCAILAAGARRRGREDEAARYDAVAAHYRPAARRAHAVVAAPETLAAARADR
jgi:hypothetical protein